MQKVLDYVCMLILLAIFIFVLASLAGAATLTFSCDGDPVAAGYRLQTTADLQKGPWSEVAVHATCNFVVQLPEEVRYWRVCAFKDTVESCAATRGYFTRPAPAPLNVGSIGLK